MSEEKLHVVYPLIPGFAHRDFEFRHSLRSLEKNLTVPYDVTVIGRYLPLWVKPGTIRFVTTETGRSKEALRKACDLYDRFLWMNDDIYLGKECSMGDFEVRRWHEELHGHPSLKVWEEFKELYAEDRHKGAAFAAQHDLTKWKRRMWTTRDLLAEYGREAYNFSLHAPYLFDSKNLIELGDEFPGIWTSEHVVETAYFNTYTDFTLSGDIEWVGAYNSQQGDSIGIDGYRFINHNDDGLTDKLKTRIKRKFPRKTPFEK